MGQPVTGLGVTVVPDLSALTQRTGVKAEACSLLKRLLDCQLEEAYMHSGVIAFTCQASSGRLGCASQLPAPPHATASVSHN